MLNRSGVFVVSVVCVSGASGQLQFVSQYSRFESPSSPASVNLEFNDAAPASRSYQGSRLVDAEFFPGLMLFTGQTSIAASFTPTQAMVTTRSQLSAEVVEPFINDWYGLGSLSQARVRFAIQVSAPTQVLLEPIQTTNFAGQFMYNYSSGPVLTTMQPFGGIDVLSPMVVTLQANTVYYAVMDTECHYIRNANDSTPTGGFAEAERGLRITVVPTPGTVALLATAGLLVSRRRR